MKLGQFDKATLAAEAEAVKVQEAEAAALAQEEAAKQRKLMERSEKVHDLIIYGTQLAPRRVLAIWQEGFKLMEEPSTKSMIIRENCTNDFDWKGELGRCYPVCDAIVISVGDIVEHAIDESAENPELSVAAIAWLNLIVTPWHERFHRLLGADEQAVEEETMKLVFQLAKSINIEMPTDAETDYFSHLISTYIEELRELDEDQAKAQVTMYDTRSIYIAADGSGEVHDMRTWMKFEAPADDRNDPLWNGDKPDAVLDSGQLPLSTDAGAPGITEPAVEMPSMEVAQANEMLNNFSMPTIPTENVAGTYQMPTLPAEPAPSAPAQQEPWKSSIPPVQITMAQQAQWQIIDQVFAKLFVHLVTKCGFNSTNGTFDPNGSLCIHEPVSISEFPGAQEIFLGMDCGTGPNATFTRNVGIFTDPVNGNGCIKGWRSQAGNPSYLLHMNGASGVTRIQMSMQNPTTSAPSAQLAAQGIPIAWVRICDAPQGTKPMYKITAESGTIKVEATAGQRG